MSDNAHRQAIAQLLASFSGQQNILTIPRPYIDLCDGDILAALLLSQCVYWSDRTRNADGWFAKSYGEWQEELSLSQYQVSRAVKVLAPLGLETKLKKFDGAPTVHYRVNMDEFLKCIIKKLDNPGLSRNFTMSDQETSQSLTETTTKITSKPTAKAVVVDAVVVDALPAKPTTTTTTSATNAFKLWEQEIGVLTPLVSDAIKDWLANYPAGWAEDAIREARLSSGKAISPKYVQAILDRWKQDGKNTPRPAGVNFKPPVRAAPVPAAAEQMGNRGMADIVRQRLKEQKAGGK